VQDKPCGCRTASQCWKKCCCFTNTQKISWAESRGVSVPEYVRKAALEEARAHVSPADRELCSVPNSVNGLELLSRVTARHTTAKSVSGRRTCSHCRPVQAKSAVENSSSVKLPECGIAKDSANAAREDATASRKARRPKWVLAILAAECHGQGFYGFAITPALIPDVPTVETTPQVPPDSCIPASERLSSATLRPPLPPPKIS
jgi:hypothetical protein